MLRIIHEYWKIPSALGAVLLIWFLFFSLPYPLFKPVFSTVLLDRQGQFLGAKVASDEQWRFPERDTTPVKFAAALIAFEDKRFEDHPGVDPIALARAMWLNVRYLRKVSGGSTLTMQVIRLSRKDRSRTVWEKLIEIILAFRLELGYSKSQILSLYASHAPFGGNVVGLDAASWKYFGRQADQLSWAEAATLAVLPNSPSLVTPGKNRDILRRKRDFVLGKLLTQGVLDSLAWELAQSEPLPDKPYPLPSYAPHLLERTHDERIISGQSEAIRSTLDLGIQRQVDRIAHAHLRSLRANQIQNLGILVAEVSTGQVVAYVANGSCDQEVAACYVNMIEAPRSTGSILKPFLYGAMIHEGLILPDQMVLDIPSNFGGYIPKNYQPVFDGVVPASKALARSLNVPAVQMLNDYGTGKFKAVLQDMGLTTLHRASKAYGLTLILGGAEATLWDLTGVYASMGRTLMLAGNVHFRPLTYRADHTPKSYSSPLGKGAIWHTIEAMAEVGRPEAEAGWKSFASAPKIAWKTGTSFGARDAWAIGCTPDYVVAIWVGNASGEGRPGMSGIASAAPVMFSVWNVLTRRGGSRWFEKPEGDMIPQRICAQSGYLATSLCPDAKEMDIAKSLQSPQICPFHREVMLDPTRRYRAHSGCMEVHRLVSDTFLVLPPIAETYHLKRNPNYRKLPPFLPACQPEDHAPLAIHYPTDQAKIMVPRNLDRSLSSLVCKASHRSPSALIYWHLDDQYIGLTTEVHKVSINPSPGFHTLTLVDEQGISQKIRFEVLETASDQER